MEIEKAIERVRKFQRHELLRTYDETGHVANDSMELSQAIDALIAAVENKPST